MEVWFLTALYRLITNDDQQTKDIQLLHLWLPIGRFPSAVKWQYVSWGRPGSHLGGPLHWPGGSGHCFFQKEFGGAMSWWSDYRLVASEDRGSCGRSEVS